MNFNTWLDTMIEEKGLDTEHRFTKKGPSGENSIPLGCVIDAIKGAPKNERQQIKNTIVRIDFLNGNLLHYFEHLAGALAK